MRTLLISAGFSLVALATSASAQMMGQSMDAEWRYSDFVSVLESHTVTVSGGVELPSTAINNDSKFSIDIGDDYILFEFNAASNWTNSNFNGWLFRDDLGTLPPITGYSLDSVSAGISGTANIVTGFNDDEFWADFGGMTVAGGGDWIRLNVFFDGLNLSVANLTAGQMATITVTGATDNGPIGVAYSRAGGGPASVDTGSCGLVTVDLSWPINVLGVFNAVGTTMTTNQTVPASTTGMAIWMQAMDMTTCELSNGIAETIQ